MQATLRAFWRLFRLFLLIWAGVWLTFRHGSGPDASARLARARRWWCARVLDVAGIRVRREGEAVRGPAMVVANHVSWLDIPVLGTIPDMHFVSKSEVARWPVIGWLARRHQTLFIRRGGHESEALAAKIADALARGQKVVVFPEGTTTRGDAVRRFHPRLFAAAIAAEAPVQPVAIDYGREPDGSPPKASYAGGDRLLSHVWQLLCRDHTDVQVKVLTKLPVTSDSVRRALATKARAEIVHALSLSETPGICDRQERRG